MNGKKWWAPLAACALLALCCLAPARAKSPAKMHKVVFEMSLDGIGKWEAVLRNASNVQKSFGAENTRIEIVAHGSGLGMLLGKTSVEYPALKKAIGQLHKQGVVFAACHNTMQRKKVSRADLLQVAVVVDSGVAEVVRKQEAGLELS